MMAISEMPAHSRRVGSADETDSTATFMPHNLPRVPLFCYPVIGFAGLLGDLVGECAFFVAP